MLLLLTAAIPQASHAALVFTDEASFISALSGLSGLSGTQVLLDFESAASGPIDGSEFSALGFAFESPVTGPAGQLSIVPGGTGAYLSIGRQPFAPGDDGNNDSLEVTIIGDCRALGFRIIDGAVPQNGESVTFYGENDEILYSRSPLDGAVSYIGIIADSPIRRVSIVEAANDFDDIGYDNFRLASVVPDGFALIPGGSFTMGATSGDTDTNAPPVTVTVSSFYLAETPTTKAQWDLVRNWGLANGYTDLGEGAGKAADHPVQTVSWWDVVKWSNARSEMEGLTPVYTAGGETMRTGTTVPDVNWSANGYRLPTEAEWEKAARGGVSGKRFPWGDQINHDHANYQANGNAYAYDTSPYTNFTFHPDYSTGGTPSTSPVGSFAPNGYGLSDMSGNVWEWCWDWYAAGTYAEEATDPQGPGSGTYRVFRGGGWNGYAIHARCSDRYYDAPSYMYYDVGFRSARNIDTDAPPIADAGVDFSVNQGELGVMLDGSGSSHPNNAPLTYEWEQVAGTTVALTGANTINPTFTAPIVAEGGETLSFDLTVTAIGGTSTDTVNVTIVNVNHAPVADAGPDQTQANGTAVAEGSPVTLDGSGSFDIDKDVIDFTWTQISGPAVTLVGAATANPTFDAPYFNEGGVPGVVATLTFELFVDDGFPADAVAEGYTLANVRDTVTIEITNTNNLPVASAGPDQTVDECTFVTLDGSLSTDPDSDVLTYSWAQVGGPPVVLADATTVAPSFTAPSVNAGGVNLEFELTVEDGYGGSDTDDVVIHVQNINDPPDASLARPSIDLLWPPNHGLVAVGILGVVNPGSNATITITSVFQDEPTNGLGDGDTPIDAIIDGDTVLLRAERSGKGNGRVYHIHFTASDCDCEGTSSGVVKVSVPHNKKKAAVDGGALFKSTE